MNDKIQDMGMNVGGQYRIQERFFRIERIREL